MKVRTHLGAMALVILVPATVLWAFALGILLDAQRSAARQELQVAARSVALAVDREIAVAETALRVLATSGHLASGDLAAFHRQAVEARTSESAWILLFDRDAQQLVNTRFPPGTPLARRANPERVAEVIETQRASVSDVYTGALTRRPIVTVDVPVPVGGGRRYVLTQSFFPEYFERAITGAGLRAGWSVRILDGRGRVVAASRAPGPDAAAPAPQAGDEVHEAASRMERSRWSVKLTAPVELVDGPARRAVLIAALGILGAFFVAFLVALALGRNLALAISSVAQTAAAIGTVPVRTSGARNIEEIDRLRKVLAQVQAERERLLESERQARALAEARNAAKDDFVAMLAHELRNPLSAITSAAGVLAAVPGLPPPAARCRDVVARQAAHMKRMVEDLIDARRVVAGKAHLETERLDLAQAVRQCVAALEDSGAARKHEVRLDAGTAWVDADPMRLEQVVNNLLGNAVKYTPAGGYVHVEVCALDGEAVLRVRDDGVGIAPEVIDRIFEPFVQGTDPQRAGGAGLGVGLAVVRQLVSMHGGSVSAASGGKGRGSVFTLRLPLKDAPEAVARDALSIAGRRVLVADAHEDGRRTTRRLLEAHGCTVFEASDGGEALRLADREKPDLALIDVAVRNPDGYGVARSLAAAPSTRPPHLVAVADCHRSEILAQALAAGFDDCIGKPLEAQRLLQAIARMASGGGPQPAVG